VRRIGTARLAGWLPLDLSEPSGRYLNLLEPEETAVVHAQKLSGRSASTVSRELARNGPTGRNRHMLD
jgi:hypothetical protein